MQSISFNVYYTYFAFCPPFLLGFCGGFWGLDAQEEAHGVFDRLFDFDEEGHCLFAIHNAVVVGEGDIHHWADFDFVGAAL